MGNSNLTLGRWGCTTSCVATLGTWFNEIKTPKDLALCKNLYTSGGLILWKEIGNIYTKMKFLYRYYTFQEKIIDDSLKNPDTVVLLNVDRGYHWVAGLSKVLGGYKCSDPYPYPAITRIYKKADICGFAVLIKK